MEGLNRVVEGLIWGVAEVTMEMMLVVVVLVLVLVMREVMVEVVDVEAEAEVVEADAVDAVDVAAERIAAHLKHL